MNLPKTPEEFTMWAIQYSGTEYLSQVKKYHPDVDYEDVIMLQIDDWLDNIIKNDFERITVSKINVTLAVYVNGVLLGMVSPSAVDLFEQLSLAPLENSPYEEKFS